MNKEKSRKCNTGNDIAGKGDVKMNTAPALQRENFLSVIMTKFQNTGHSCVKSKARKKAMDYSVFGSITTYEKQVIDTLRVEGLADSEIVKCLKEL